MKKNIANKLFIICSVLAITGCAARKHTLVTRQPDAAAKPLNTINSKLEAIRATQVNFTTFAGRAKTQLAINGNANDVTLNIRISKDKKIWVSITAILGIEAARAVITPDSIMIINRLQSVYVKKPFSYIYNYASKQVNYKTIESLLIGNAIPELLNDQANFDQANGNTTINGTLQDLIYKLMLGPDMKVTQTNLDNQAQSQSLQVANSTFIQTTNRILPSQIDITSVVKDKKIQVNLHYTKADFEVEQNYPFSIPDNYEPVN